MWVLACWNVSRKATAACLTTVMWLVEMQEMKSLKLWPSAFR